MPDRITRIQTEIIPRYLYAAWHHIMGDDATGNFIDDAAIEDFWDVAVRDCEEYSIVKYLISTGELLDLEMLMISTDTNRMMREIRNYWEYDDDDMNDLAYENNFEQLLIDYTLVYVYRDLDYDICIRILNRADDGDTDVEDSDDDDN